MTLIPCQPGVFFVALPFLVIGLIVVAALLVLAVVACVVTFGLLAAWALERGEPPPDEDEDGPGWG
jgi:hypothetical protein